MVGLALWSGCVGTLALSTQGCTAAGQVQGCSSSPLHARDEGWPGDGDTDNDVEALHLQS